MAEIKFRCPSCNQKIGVAGSEAGRNFDCPVCGTNLVVPSRSDESVQVLANRSENQGGSASVALPPVSVAAGGLVGAQGASMVAQRDASMKKVPGATPPPPPPPGALTVTGLSVGARPIGLGPQVPAGMSSVTAAAVPVVAAAPFEDAATATRPPGAATCPSGPDVSGRLVSEFEESREQLARLRQRLHELESENARMENEIRENGEERKRAQLRSIQVQDEFKWQVAKLTQESEETKKAAQLAEARASHAERELAKSRQEQMAATQELDTLRKEISTVSSEVEGLRQELMASQSSLESERRKLREVGERFAISERERVELQRQVPVTGTKPDPTGPGALSTQGGAA